MNTIKRILIVFLCLLMLLPMAACKKDKDTDGKGKDDGGKTSEQEKNDAVKLPDIVTGSITFMDYGMVTFELYPNVARQSCLNFIYLANSGHYNGIIVDRLVKDFVIQAGNYQSGFVPRNTEFDYTIKGEFKNNGIENSMQPRKGAMAWVTTGDNYDSASKEFAIYTDSATTWDLENKVAVFGFITGDDSFDVLKKINKKKTYAEKPVKEIMITSLIIDPVNPDMNPGFDKEFEFPKPNFIMAEGAKDTKKSGD